MSQATKQQAFVFPEQLAESAEARAAMGRRVSELIGTPAWADLLKGIDRWKDERTEMLMSGRPSEDGSLYADVVGQMKGAKAIEQIARALIEVGEEAEDEIRLKEES